MNLGQLLYKSTRLQKPYADISEQTNLLALNAIIEAARAEKLRAIEALSEVIAPFFCSLIPQLCALAGTNPAPGIDFV